MYKYRSIYNNKGVNTMIKILIFILALGSIASAGEAVKELNYSVGTGVHYDEFSDNLDSKGYGVFGDINIPISTYVGLSLDAFYSKDKTNQDIKSDYKGLSSDIFLRDKNIGKFGVGFSYAVSGVDTDDVNFDITTKTVFTYVEYYLANFTFDGSLNHYTMDLDIKHQDYNTFVELADDSYVDCSLGVSWYILENIKLKAEYISDVGGSDISSDFYTLGVSYQPNFLNDNFETSFLYSHDNDWDSYYLSISYHFMRATLKDRDRTYR